MKILVFLLFLLPFTEVFCSPLLCSVKLTELKGPRKGRSYKISQEVLDSSIEAIYPSYEFYRRFLRLTGHEGKMEWEKSPDYFLAKIRRFTAAKNKNVSLLRPEDHLSASLKYFLDFQGYNPKENLAYLIHHRRRVLGVFIITKSELGKPIHEDFLFRPPQYVNHKVRSTLRRNYQEYRY